MRGKGSHRDNRIPHQAAFGLPHSFKSFFLCIFHIFNRITNFVSIVTHSSHRAVRLMGRSYATHAAPAQERPGYRLGSVHIGAYAFIGPHSLVEPGSRIGKGAVVCAYAQVRGEVPDFAIVAGQPARVVGDVRTRDAVLLAQYPDMAEHYRAWAGELPRAPHPDAAAPTA